MPKDQRQINQVQATDETTPEPPGIENTESSEVQLNHLNCESANEYSENESTLVTNMLK